MSDPLLTVKDLTVSARLPFGGSVQTLHGVDLTVVPGEVVALIGESGAGKTTLALSALGYARAGTELSGGTVHYLDLDLRTMDAPARQAFRGREVAYVAQSAAAALNPAMTIGAQILEILNVHGYRDRQVNVQHAIDLMAKLHLPDPEGLMRRYPLSISGGQQQRVMMAMALACHPKLLVLDEPTTALDVTTQIEVLKAIKDIIADLGTAAIYVTHDLSVVAQVADRILVMKDGQVVDEGVTDTILTQSTHEYTNTLMAAAHQRPSEATADVAPIPAPQEARLSVQGVSASYAKRRLFAPPKTVAANVLHGVSLDVFPSEILALVGESGSGKSTLARVIAGLHAPTEGTITLSSRTLAAKVPQRSKDDLRRIQMVFQSPEQSLNPENTIEAIIGRSLTHYHGMKGRRRRERVAELLEMVDLPADALNRYPRELSGGQRQRVSIARAFAAEPEIILCDEFLSALDTVVAARILELMERLRAKHQVSYVFISHDLATVASVADRMAVMYAGRIVETGRTRDVFRPPHHPYTRLLIESIPELRQGWLEDVLERRHVSEWDGTTPRDGLCPFRPRCPLAHEPCAQEPPPVRDLGNGQNCLCWLERPALAEQTN